MDAHPPFFKAIIFRSLPRLLTSTKAAHAAAPQRTKLPVLAPNKRFILRELLNGSSAASKNLNFVQHSTCTTGSFQRTYKLRPINCYHSIIGRKQDNKTMHAINVYCLLAKVCFGLCFCLSGWPSCDVRSSSGPLRTFLFPF